MSGLPICCRQMTRCDASGLQFRAQTTSIFQYSEHSPLNRQSPALTQLGGPRKAICSTRPCSSRIYFPLLDLLASSGSCCGSDCLAIILSIGQACLQATNASRNCRWVAIRNALPCQQTAPQPCHCCSTYEPSLACVIPCECQQACKSPGMCGMLLRKSLTGKPDQLTGSA